MVARCFADPHEYLDGGGSGFALTSGIVIWLLFGPGAISAPAELAAPSVAAIAAGAPKPAADVATEVGVDSEATNASA